MQRFFLIYLALLLVVIGVFSPGNVARAEREEESCPRGDECAGENAQGACADAAIGCYCFQEAGDAGPTCHPKLTAGEACSDPQPCQAGLECTPGAGGRFTCEERIEGFVGSDVGGACGRNFDCSVGRCETVGACICREGICDINPEAPTGEKKATTTAAPSIPRLTNPLGAGITVQEIIGKVIKAILGISGSLALAFFVWGGFLWLTSGGNTEKIEQGKRTLVWATLGLALIFGAYAITDFVVKAISGAAGT